VSYGSADAPIPAVAGTPVTAVFSTEGVSGHGGCNGYGGTFQYNQGTITFGPIISTLMACEPPEITTQESAYLAALQSASTYTITGDTLQIVYDGGVLTYTAGTATPIVPTLPPGATGADPTLGGLAGTVWTLVSYGPADAPVPAVAGAPVTAVFADQGVSGSAGCNSYNGPFVYSQNTITFGAMVSTLMACAEQEVSAQEAAYLAALPSATTFTVANGTLQIVYDGGVLTFTAS
jgi:heat shock protein HslJ